MKKRIILFCALVTSFLSAHAHKNKFFKTTLSHYLTMDDAVEQALEHRPNLEALKFATYANKSASKAELAEYYPKIRLDSSFTQQSHQDYPANTTLLNTDQLIYSFAGPLQRYKRAKLVAEQTEAEREVQKNNVRLETEKAFLQAWLVQEQQKTIASLARSALHVFDKAKHEHQLELSDKSTWFKGVEDYGSSSSQVEQYTYNVASAYKRLEFLMGASISLLSNGSDGAAPSPSTHLSWHPEKVTAQHPLETYYTHALRHRPERTQNEKKIAAEQQNIKIAQGLRLPTFTANAQAGHVSFLGSVPLGSRSDSFHQFSVAMSWPLFDGLVNQYQEQQAYANKVKEMLNQDQTILTIKQEVQDRYFALAKALTALKAQKLQYLRTNNDFERSKQEFEIGQISAVDFDVAKTTWQQAQLDWLARNIDVALAERDLMFVCGYPTQLMRNNHEIVS